MKIVIPLNREAIVSEIEKFTNFSKTEIEYRLGKETENLGWNVLQDAKRLNVIPHKYDDRMALLYHEGDGFIFETMVYWTRFDRRCWIEHAKSRVKLYGLRKGLMPSDVSVLCFGDGTGNDTLELVNNGYTVDYFEVPGSKIYDFAVKRFKHYDLIGSRVNIIDDPSTIIRNYYDVVICFDVLEHLFLPLLAVQNIYHVMKTQGVALVTESFGEIRPNLPTHLSSNLTLAGRTPFIFFKNRLLLTWYSINPLFRPYEFTKIDVISFKKLLPIITDGRILRTFFSYRFYILKAMIHNLIRH